MAEFVKQFNDATSAYKPNTPLPVKLSAFSDRTFSFVVQVRLGEEPRTAEVEGYPVP